MRRAIRSSWPSTSPKRNDRCCPRGRRNPHHSSRPAGWCSRSTRSAIVVPFAPADRVAGTEAPRRGQKRARAGARLFSPVAAALQAPAFTAVARVRSPEPHPNVHRLLDRMGNEFDRQVPCLRRVKCEEIRDLSHLEMIAGTSLACRSKATLPDDFIVRRSGSSSRSRPEAGCTREHRGRGAGRAEVRPLNPPRTGSPALRDPTCGQIRPHPARHARCRPCAAGAPRSSPRWCPASAAGRR